MFQVHLSASDLSLRFNPFSSSRRYGPTPQLRGQEESRDWLRSHSTSGLQDSASNSPFSPGLTSPSGTRFNFGQLGTPTRGGGAAGTPHVDSLRSVT